VRALREEVRVPADRRVPDGMGFDGSDIPDPLASAARPPHTAAQPPSEPSPTRSGVRRRRLLALVLGVGWLTGALLVMGHREDISPGGWRAIVLFCALAVTAVVAATAPGRRGLGVPLPWVRAISMVAPLVFMVIAPLWAGRENPAELFDFGPADAFFGCLSNGALLVVPLVGLGAVAFLRAFPSGATWRGRAIGVAAGLGGAIVLTLHCGVTAGGHVAFAHGIPIIFAALGMGYLGSRLARI
jgi:Negative regulator of sigma F